MILAIRYKELFAGGGGGGGGSGDIPYEIDTGKIDADFMNTRFDKYLKMLGQPGIDQDQLQQTLDEVHKSFAYLIQEEQKYANIFLNDVHRGDADLAAGMTFRDHITHYRSNAKDAQISSLAHIFGLKGKNGVGPGWLKVSRYCYW